MPVAEVAKPCEGGRPNWLIEDLWSDAAVGVLGGPPKACKSWLGLDMAVSVASGTPCLGRFAVDAPGPAVVFLAEDSPTNVRQRVAHICSHRDLQLRHLPLHVITAPALRLDLERDRHALEATLTALAPRLLLLDPLVRLHRCDENSAAEISALLGHLREINRRHNVAIVLAHHMAKRQRRDLGQGLRGSSDIHAWTDSACYLMRRSDGAVRLTIEHRSACVPEPMLLRLAAQNGEPPHLEVQDEDGNVRSKPLLEAVRSILRTADAPRTRAQLRQELRVNNARLGTALAELEQRRLAVRTAKGWRRPEPNAPIQLTINAIA
jgi:hypothetical protein